MSASQYMIQGDENADYRSHVENVLSEAEFPMSVTDIRIELEYRDNGFRREEGYSASQMESDIQDAVEELVEDNRSGSLEHDLERHINADSSPETELYRLI